MTTITHSTIYNTSNGHYQSHRKSPFISANGSMLPVSSYRFFCLHGISSSFERFSNRSIYRSQWPTLWHTATILSKTLVVFVCFVKSTARESQVIQSLSLSFTHLKVLQEKKRSSLNQVEENIIILTTQINAGWKKLLFAQSPRQIIAAFTVAALLKSAWTVNGMVDDDGCDVWHNLFG